MSSNSRSRNELNYKRTRKPCSKEDCKVERLSYCHEISNLQFLIKNPTLHPGPSTIKVIIKSIISVCMESSISSNTLSGSGAKYLFKTVEHK